MELHFYISTIFPIANYSFTFTHTLFSLLRAIFPVSPSVSHSLIFQQLNCFLFCDRNATAETLLLYALISMAWWEGVDETCLLVAPANGIFVPHFPRALSHMVTISLWFQFYIFTETTAPHSSILKMGNTINECYWTNPSWVLFFCILQSQININHKDQNFLSFSSVFIFFFLVFLYDHFALS